MADEQDLEEVFEEGEDVLELHQNDLMKLFDTLTFREKWKRVFMGLKQPQDSGAYKWAKLQMVRLLSPAMAVVVPILMLGLITLFASMNPEPVRSVKVKVLEPEAAEELEDIEEPIIDQLEPPDPVEMDFTPDTTLPPSEVAAPPQDVSVQPAEFDSVAMVKSPVIMKGMYGSRNPGSQGAALNRYGGSGTEGAVLRALRYIKKNQAKDGSWGASKPAMTALALLAYLAHGDTPASAEFGYAVESGIRFLVGAQKANGHFTGADGHDYTQPIVAYALCEAYGLTKVPQLKTAAIKAVKPIIKGQNPSGGFNYNLKPTTRDDSSYMAWCVQALKAAKMAGLYGDIPGLDKCMTKSIAGFKKNYGEKDGYGGFGYTGPSSNHGLTGAGVLCLQFLGAAKSRECRGGLAGLSKWTFDWDNPRSGSFVYYMYYTTQAKFQEGGNAWKSWNKQFSPTLMKQQDVVGKDASGYVDHRGQAQDIGSWKSPAKKEHTGSNPIMDTILCTLMLEVYYRYLPTFVPVPEVEHDDDVGDDDDLEIDIVDGGNAPALELPRRHQRFALDGSESLDLQLDLI
ncbi:MAG: terpene cyclase/mutase family protein [Verrucomicrobia bacterium]|nr:terpene cyclase/mutase family protein [Verrucomicrobiota bacterium]